MELSNPLHLLGGATRRVWRGLIPLMKSCSNFYDRYLLTVRLWGRRAIPRASNVFTATSPLAIPVFVINLRKRPDRLKDVRTNLERLGFSDIRVVVAIDGPEENPDISRGHAANLGCTRSHMAAVMENLKPGQVVAVCEDDNEFLAPTEKIRGLISSFLQAPEYDVLCLSARVRGPKVVASEDFNVVSWALAPAFYIAKPRARGPLLQAYKRSVTRLTKERRKGPFDQVWATTQRYRLIFATTAVRVARQKESHSDIQGKFFGGT